MTTDPSLGANPNHGVNPDHGVNASHGVSAGLGTEAARGMRERAEARKLARQQHEAAEKAATPEGELLAKIRELQYRCLKLEARNPAEQLQRSFRLAVAGGAGGLGDHPFKVIRADATHLRYIFGIVGNVVPTVDGTPMDGFVGTYPGTPPVLDVTAGGVSYLETVWGGASEPYTLQSAAVKVGAGVPDDDLTHGYQLLATHTMVNGALDSIAQGVTHSLAVERVACGGGASYYWGAI